jgi:rhodanese-related sulfurtransferase/biotin operon repressor
MSSKNAKRELFVHFASIAKALGNEHRLELLEHLGQGERSVETLADRTALPVANVSQHLQQLRRAGLVETRRHGKRMLYRLADDSVVRLISALQGIAERNLAAVKEVVRVSFRARDELEPVSREQLARRMRRGLVTVLDVRPEDEFALGHLPGAMNIPLPELNRRLAELPKRQEIVAYCRGPYCVLSYLAIEALRKRGFQVRRLEAGYPEWRAAGLPVEQPPVTNQ